MTTELELQHWSVILWDLDGTITDSGGEITQRISKALRIVGWPVPSLQELERLIGPPLYDGFIEVLGMPPEKAMETLTAQRTIAELQGLGRRSAVYSGIAPLLAELASDGIPMAVASSKGEHQVHSVLDHFDLSRYFLVRVGSDEAAGRTSKSLVIGEALRQLDETGVDLSRDGGRPGARPRGGRRARHPDRHCAMGIPQRRAHGRSARAPAHRGPAARTACEPHELRSLQLLNARTTCTTPITTSPMPSSHHRVIAPMSGENASVRPAMMLMML